MVAIIAASTMAASCKRTMEVPSWPIGYFAAEQQRRRFGSEAELPLLPSAAMPGRASARSRRWPELGAGLARVGRLEDFGAAGEFGLARFGAGGAEGQGFRAVHFVEVGFVDL